MLSRQIIRIIAVFVLVTTSSSALTRDELKLLDGVVRKYFKTNGVHYSVEYMANKPEAKVYEFTYLKWDFYRHMKGFQDPNLLTEDDIKNGIIKKVKVFLRCSGVYRFKENNTWSVWSDGGNDQLKIFDGLIIYNQTGMHFDSYLSHKLKKYSIPHSKGEVIPLKKNSTNYLPAGVKRVSVKR